MANKEDLRIIRTRKLIGEAFLKLIKQKGFDNITIQNIADEAMINRATFYLHYQDKYDLLDQMMNSVLQELLNIYNPKKHIQKQQVMISKLRLTIQSVYENVERHRSFYQVMLGEHGIYDFRVKLEEFVVGRFEENIIELNMNEDDFKIPKKILIHFASSAFVGMIDWWLKEENYPTPKEMSLMMSQIVLKGPVGAAGIEVGDHL
ncbi:TetR/AcrR family transcriptional regulator [Chengkuizengella axinellae]|uniref:TetR/AcrR family transcriptional regulator n=1 Tax=Chengkuizengella axinellae TaxID=3064388 RepID=A0ABT9J475_9BACL|nr:TetR/AcrR family transcriptional regulator [Chengkuizengella sp. 2205SS18-9]MDP5276445.1 TetR/AcrR family transcriptional regulator [Chengkuizengella sp. 2205SS18-9]